MAATDATKFLNKTEYTESLSRMRSYIDGVVPTKLSDLTDDVVAGNYLPLSGGTMTGTLAWKNATALPATTEASYFLAIDAFASGGQTKYITAANLAKSIASNVATEIGLSNYLSYYQYAVSGARNYYWVRINDTSSWSGSFTVKVYDGYHFEIYEIGGYNYTNSTGWYNARARLLLSSSRSSVSVVFGYTAAQELWFVIPTVTTGSGQPHRLMICDYNGTNLQEDVDFSCTTVTSMDDVEGTVQSTVTLATYLSTATGVTIDTDQTISGTKVFSSGLLTISAATSGSPTLEFRRGTTSDAYVDYKIVSTGGALQFVYSASGTDTVKAQFVTSAFRPAGTVTDNVSDITLGNSDYYWSAVYAKDYYVGSTSSRVYSSATTNIALMNSSGTVLVCDAKVVRRGTASSLANTTLGDATYPWGGVYSTSFVKSGGTASQFLKADGSVDDSIYWDMKAAYHFTNGYMVETDLVSTANQMIYFIIEGRKQGGYPFLFQGNAWYQTSGSVFASGYSFATKYGASIGDITLFVYDGHICMWFAQPSNYCMFRVTITSGAANRVTSITNSAIPSGASSQTTITPGAALADTYLPLAGGTLTGNLIINNNKGIYFKDTSNANKSIIEYNSSNQLYIGYGQNTTNRITYLCGNTIVFQSGSHVEAMRLSDAGNLGIGTTSPSYKLHVSGTMGVSGVSTLAGGIVLGTSTNAVAAKMEWDETNNAWKLNGNFYATGFVSAGGLNSQGGSGGGSTVTVIRAWSEYVATDTSQALGANLGYSLKSSIDDLDQDIYELDNRVTALEQGGGGGGTTTDPTLRMYPSNTNAWYPILTRYDVTTGSTYYTEYGRYSTAVTINHSTGSLLATSISALNLIETQGSLDIGLDASIGGSLTVTGDSTFSGVTAFEDSITIDGVITLVDGQSSAEYQYPRYKLCASEAAYNAIVTKQSDVLYLIPES